MIVLSIRDTKAEASMNPFCMRSKGEAIRAFGDECQRTDGKSPIAQHPEDYILFQVGLFDELSGRLTSIDPVPVCSGVDFIERERQEV